MDKAVFARARFCSVPANPGLQSSATSTEIVSPDIVVTHHELNQLTVLLGDGRGGFVEAAGSPFDFGKHAFHTIVADVNRDGKADVIAAGGDSLLLMLGDGRGQFQPGPRSQTGRGTWRLDVGDLNGDAKMDVVTSNTESGTVSVLLGR